MDEIAWPELENDATGGGFSVLNPPGTRKTGGAGFEMEKDRDGSGAGGDYYDDDDDDETGEIRNGGWAAGAGAVSPRLGYDPRSSEQFYGSEGGQYGYTPAYGPSSRNYCQLPRGPAGGSHHAFLTGLTCACRRPVPPRRAPPCSSPHRDTLWPKLSRSVNGSRSVPKPAARPRAALPGQSDSLVRNGRLGVPAAVESDLLFRRRRRRRQCGGRRPVRRLRGDEHGRCSADIGGATSGGGGDGGDPVPRGRIGGQRAVLAGAITYPRVQPLVDYS